MFWNQILHGRSVAVFGCQMFKKWPFKLGRMYQTAHKNNGFNALRLCCSKLNPACLCYDSKPAKLHKARWAIQLTSQPSSRTAKSGKCMLLSTEIKRSDIHLEVLSLQNRKSFEYFLCFHRTLGISPKDWAFIYSTLACSLARWPSELWFDLCNAKFHWFVRYQMCVWIG